MRLVCPSCEAKYEVPDDAIPDAGRDVQCANCGHGWFQARAKPAPKAPPIPPVAEKPKAESEKPQRPAAPVAEASVARPDPERRLSFGAGPDGAGDADVPREPPARVPNEKVLAILREEAEREAKARREKTRLLDEPAMPVSASTEQERPKPPAKPPAPPPRPPAPPPEPEIELKVAARRDLLPDVEEIKSTLKPSEVEEPEFVDGSHADYDRTEGGRPFRAGFLSVITLAILAASVYISTPWLSAKVPALAGPLASYVEAVDDLRLALDGLMRTATLMISGEAG